MAMPAPTGIVAVTITTIIIPTTYDIRTGAGAVSTAVIIVIMKHPSSPTSSTWRR
jgi:hypothetical protein